MVGLRGDQLNATRTIAAGKKILDRAVKSVMQGVDSLGILGALDLTCSFIHSFTHFVLPLTRNTTTVYRNTLKIIYNIPTKLFTRSNVVKARTPI